MEGVFFLFSQKTKDGEVRLETLGDALNLLYLQKLSKIIGFLNLLMTSSCRPIRTLLLGRLLPTFDRALTIS